MGDDTTTRPFGHALVVGINTPVRKVTKHQSQKIRKKKSRFKTFIKMVNYNHLMPTRYNLDPSELKSVVSADTLESRNKKVDAAKACKKILEIKLMSSEAKWFFSKLKF